MTPAEPALKEPQTFFRKVSVWEKGSTENPIEHGACALCDFYRDLVFNIAYDWEFGVAREILSICDSCYLELATHSKALEAREGEALAELRDELKRTATTGFNASSFKKYVISEIEQRINAPKESS